MTEYLEEVFGDGGLLARRFPGYEKREGQVALAHVVDQAMRDGRHALGEGPCGTGKGVAYGVPAVWHARHRGKKVVIATANIALQEQLVRKDLPLLADVLPWKFTFALLKGKGNFLCLSGDTRVLTRAGIREIAALAGGAHELLDGRGKWVRSEVHAFGQQRLMRMVVRRNRREKVVHATADHRWFRQLARDRGEALEVTTVQLRPGDRLAVVFPRPIARKLRPSPFGVAHGITFGDGSQFGVTVNGWRTANLVLHGSKKEELLRFFRESRCRRMQLTDSGYAEDAVRVSDLPMFFRELPRLDEAPSYLYGWLAGYVATDGSVSEAGEVTLSSARRDNLEFVEALCLRLGIGTGPIRERERIGIRQDGPSLIYTLPFVANTIDGEFLIRADQRARFKVVPRVRRARESWIVQSVDWADRVEETYCAEVPTTHSFVLEGYLLTGNCLDRFYESECKGALGLRDDPADANVQRALVAWARTTKTGDVSELPFVPPPQVWSRFSVGSDDCKGDGCRFRDACFAERAKAAARDADIIVTNYHLLFAHLAVRRETGQDLVLPAFDFLVLDEAHEAADIARDFFGFTVAEFTLIRLARFAEKLGKKKLADRLRREASTFFSAVANHARSPAYKCRLKRAGFASAEMLLKPLDELAGIAARIEEDESLDREDRAEGRIARRQSTTAAARIREAVALADPGKVYFINLDQKGRAKLGAKPVRVADLLREELFGRTASVTMVSATMTTAGTFDFLRVEAGVPGDALEVIADSPFDFAHQALLVVPEGLPDPREPEFVEAAATAFKKVIDLCNGRTLGLFTSYRNLNAVHERVRRNGHRMLRQGELPRTELTRVFKEDVGSVLLGTESFWTGIDVPGEALTALVIDKLPFPNMDDPVIDAICAQDRNAFNTYLVPRAIIMLRQGVGRLIRSQSDVGVAVILDRRIADKPYGRRFLKSLPPMLTTRNLDNIARFLEEASDAGPG